jgi:hypothetical protein
MPGEFGRELYDLMGFNSSMNDKPGNSLNVRRLHWKPFLVQWRVSLGEVAAKAKSLMPLTRALSNLAREDNKTSKQPYPTIKPVDKATPPWKKRQDYVAEVQNDQDQQLYCAAVGDGQLHMCHAFLGMKPCKDGPDCRYDHSKLGYDRHMETQGANFKPLEGRWAPSREKAQYLVPNKAYGGVRIVPRPPIAVHAVQGEWNSEEEHEADINKSMANVSFCPDSESDSGH